MSKLKAYFIAALVVLGLVGVIAFQQGKLKAQKARIDNLNQNLKAATDSIRIVIDKSGDTQYNKLTYLVDKVSELEKFNKDLAAEVNKTYGKVISIEKLGVKIAHDTITISDGVDTSNGNLVVRFDKDTTYSPGNARKLSGTTSIDSGRATTSITRDELYFTATTGLVKQSNGDYEIFFRSAYPGLTLTGLEGAYIPKSQITPKKKRFEFGFQAGYTPLYYDFTKKKAGFSNQITAGIGLNFKL